jgi:hypothetical protein
MTAGRTRLRIGPVLGAIGLLGGLVLMGATVGASECPARIAEARAGIEAKADFYKGKPPSRRRDRLMQRAQSLLAEAETLHNQGNHADAVARAKEGLGIVEIDLSSPGAEGNSRERFGVGDPNNLRRWGGF